MKRYIRAMHAKPTHERRQHAVKVATTVTAVLFVGWLATLGWRLSGSTSSVAAGDTSGDSGSQLANVVSGATYSNSASLEVASTTEGDDAGYTSINAQ